MNIIDRSIKEIRVVRAARDHSRLNMKEEPERVLEAVLGPPIMVPDDDLELRRQSRIAQRSRELIDEAGAVVGDLGASPPPNPAKVPPTVYLAIAVACAIADFAGSELTAFYAGVPTRQRMFVALSFTVGALLVTTGVGTAVEKLWARGFGARVGAVVICVAYVFALLIVASSRFEPIDGEEVSVMETAGGAVMALFVVGGPAGGAHLALRAWMKARPGVLAERTANRSRRSAERDLERAHATLRDTQREAREREAERQRLRALYLTTYREEAARLVQLAKPTTPSPEEN